MPSSETVTVRVPCAEQITRRILPRAAAVKSGMKPTGTSARKAKQATSRCAAQRRTRWRFMVCEANINRCFWRFPIQFGPTVYAKIDADNATKQYGCWPLERVNGMALRGRCDAFVGYARDKAGLREKISRGNNSHSGHDL